MQKIGFTFVTNYQINFGIKLNSQPGVFVGVGSAHFTENIEELVIFKSVNFRLEVVTLSSSLLRRTK